MIIISIHRKSGNSDRFYFLGLQNYCGWWLQPWNSKMLAPWKESNSKPRPDILKKRHFANKDPCSQSYGFSSGHVRLWELDHKEGWAVENWCFWPVVLEKTLESPLSCPEIKPVNPKGNQPWKLFGRTDAEAEAPTLWPPDAKSRLLEKTLMLGNIEGRKRGDNRGWDGWMASPTQWT